MLPHPPIRRPSAAGPHGRLPPHRPPVPHRRHSARPPIRYHVNTVHPVPLQSTKIRGMRCRRLTSDISQRGPAHQSSPGHATGGRRVTLDELIDVDPTGPDTGAPPPPPGGGTSRKVASDHEEDVHSLLKIPNGSNKTSFLIFLSWY